MIRNVNFGCMEYPFLLAALDSPSLTLPNVLAEHLQVEKLTLDPGGGVPQYYPKQGLSSLVILGLIVACVTGFV
jgi:hypothetical protein